MRYAASMYSLYPSTIATQISAKAATCRFTASRWLAERVISHAQYSSLDFYVMRELPAFLRIAVG